MRTNAVREGAEMSAPTTEEIADQYTSAVQRIGGLLRHASDEQASLPVPATPGWTVRDLVGHLAGVANDVVAGRMQGVATSTWTAAHVSGRADLAIPEMLGAWRADLAGVVTVIEDGGAGAWLAVDVITHEEDLRAALRLAPLEDDRALRFATLTYAVGLRAKLKRAGLPPLALRDPARGFVFVAGEGAPVATLTAREFDLCRALSGRRSRNQVLAMDWRGDPAPYLDHLNVFGPLPETDVRDF